jgi:hypothetical protein
MKPQCPKCKGFNTKREENRRGECGKLHYIKMCYDCGHKVVLKEEVD